MHTQCPYCGGNGKKIFSVHDINQKISEQEFNYYRCNKCRLIFLNPIPDNIQDYYGQAYPAYIKAEDVESEATDYEREKIAIIKQYLKGGKLLEIGPGNGTFSYLAKKEGFVVDAIEMDANCCKFLSETIKIRSVINSNDIAKTLAQVEERYDAIVMWHVLEHLKDPWNVLRAIPNILSSNGFVIIAAPNPEALQFKLFNKYWKHVDAPRHTIFFPMQLLIQEMSKSGLENIMVTTNDKVSSIFNASDWWLSSLGNFLEANHNSCIGRILKRRNVALKVYKYIVGRIERLDGYGNAYLAIFKNGSSGVE